MRAEIINDRDVMNHLNEESWLAYYDKVSTSPPRELLLKGLAYFYDSQKRLDEVAVDFGAGAGVDTKYLLDSFFKVHAIDRNKHSMDLLKNLSKIGDLSITCDDFSNVEIPSCYFFYSSLSLPFCNPHKFEEIWTRIVTSIESDGIFCGNFFGVKDDWRDKLIVQTSDEIKKRFSDFKILEWSEEEKDAPSATGPMKHWHIINIVAKKNP